MNFCKTTGCTLAACVLATSLGACGGAFDLDDAGHFHSFSPLRKAPAVPPLLQDDGQPSAPLPEAMPRSGDETTRAGLYALRDQARALDRALAGDVVWIDDACCLGDDGRHDFELTRGMVAGVMAARDLDANAPVLVESHDRRRAAALADHLAAAGYTHVFLITD